MKIPDNIYKSRIKSSDPNVLKFTESNPFHGYADVLKSINKMQTNLLPSGGVFQATQIPYTQSLYGDILENPTALSLNNSQEMVYADGVIYSSIKYLGVMITSRVGKFRHKNPEIEEVVNYSLNNLKIGKLKFFDALMTALWAGFSANYLSWTLYKGKAIISNVIPMPPTSVIMSVDQAGMLKKFGGIMQYYYNTNLNGWANSFTYGGINGNANPNIPRGDYPIPLRVPYINPMYLKPFDLDDMLLYSISGNDGPANPYGRMITRGAWQPYNYKQALLQNTLIAATYKAAPLLVFYTDSTRPIQDVNGNVFSIADNLKTQLQQYNGNGFLIVEGKKGETVEHAAVDNTANLADLMGTINQQNNEIRAALLTPETTLNSEGNFATAMAHNSTFAKIVAYMAEGLMEVLLTQFVKKIINKNWYEEDLGYFEINEPSLEAKLQQAKLLETGYNFNILCQDPLKQEQMLKDLNMARETMGWSTVDDIFINPEMAAKNGSNFGDANRAAGTPYADGINDYEERYKP